MAYLFYYTNKIQNIWHIFIIVKCALCVITRQSKMHSTWSCNVLIKHQGGLICLQELERSILDDGRIIYFDILMGKPTHNWSLDSMVPTWVKPCTHGELLCSCVYCLLTPWWRKGGTRFQAFMSVTNRQVDWNNTSSLYTKLTAKVRVLYCIVLC